jgi:hypothetical protein
MKDWMYDVDAGPIVAGYGTAASAFAIGAARTNGRFDQAYSLAAQALLASWPLPSGRLLLPCALSNLSDAPFTGESALLFSLTRTPGVAKQGETPRHSKMTYLALILYGGFGVVWIAAALERIRRWEKGFSSWKVPALGWQLGIWLSATVVGISLTISMRAAVAGGVLLLLAQLLPAGQRLRTVHNPAVKTA